MFENYFICLDINGSIPVSCVIYSKPRRPFGCTLVVPANEFREFLMRLKQLKTLMLITIQDIIKKNSKHSKINEVTKTFFAFTFRTSNCIALRDHLFSHCLTRPFTPRLVCFTDWSQRGSNPRQYGLWWSIIPLRHRRLSCI